MQSPFYRYESDKVVVFKEKTMAIIYHCIIFLLLCFLLIYVIILQQAHKETIDTTGRITTSFIGKTYGLDPKTEKIKYFDHGDLIDPFHGDNTFFIPTDLYVFQAKQDYCGRECETNDDCPNVPSFAEPKCVDNRCKEQSLCTIDPNAVEYYQIPGIQNLILKMATVTDFPGYTNYVYRRASPNGIILYPKEDATAYTIKNLLDISNTSLESVANTGAIFGLNILIECDLDSEHCTQTLDVKKVDIGSNISLPVANQKVAFYNEYTIPLKDKTNAVQQRVLVGLKFLTNVQVVAKKFSFNKLMIFLGVAFTCIAFASILVDWMMGNLRSKAKRKTFFKRKYVNSEDFSDLKDRLEEVKRLRNQQFADLNDNEDQGLA